MRIIAFIFKNSGVSYHRIIAPLMNMPDVDVFLTNDEPKEEYFEKGCDLVVYNRVLPTEIMERLHSLQERYGFKICVDIDDHWELDPHHFLYDADEQAARTKEQIWHIQQADLVTCTHERLATEVLPFNKNVHILPNAIKKQGQFDIERIASPFTRLFWQGTVTHEQDIALLQRPIAALAPLAGKIKMMIAGFEDTEDKAPVWERMLSDYTAGFKHQYKIIPGALVTDYYKAYAEADVCLIPLLNSPFNRCKSNLKVLEAANLVLPCIVSAVHPYKDLPVMYAKNSTDWVSNIKRMVGSRKRQKEAGLELAVYCEQHFNFDKINRERKQIFEYQITIA